MSNPNPEGLPSRIELPGGYSIRKGIACWLLCDPKDSVLADLFEREAKPLATAMNTPADALGAALEETLKSLVKHVEGHLKSQVSCEIGTIDKARAALEAWKVGK